VIKDAQDTNEEVVYDYEHRISKLEERNSMLEEENKQVNSKLINCSFADNTIF
jgi:hypothetical protein